MANLNFSVSEINQGLDSTVFRRRYTIGVYYFPGWPTPGGGPNPSDPWSLITTYDATRTPILGTYNEALQSINDTHFGWMKRFGIDFMALDWFQQWSGTTLVPLLDHVLTAYKASTVSKPKFCLQFANQTTNGVGITTTTWPTIYNYWISNVFTDPNYHRINGRPVVIMNSWPSFRSRFASNAETASMLAQARAASVAAGTGSIFFVGGQGDSSSAWTDLAPFATGGWDAISGSNVFRTTKRGPGATGDNSAGPDPTTYADLHNAVFSGQVGAYRGFCYGWMNSAGVDVFWPPCTAGFNAAPWQAGVSTLNGMPTLAEWTQHLITCKALLDANPVQTQLTFMIEAWNEFGEGSILEPTLGNGGFDRLSMLKNIFER